MLQVICMMFAVFACSGKINRNTGLTACTQDSISREIAANSMNLPIPERVRVIDSMIAAANLEKQRLLLHRAYDITSMSCFKRGLSMSNRVVGDTFFFCFSEGRR